MCSVYTRTCSLCWSSLIDSLEFSFAHGPPLLPWKCASLKYALQSVLGTQVWTAGEFQTTDAEVMLAITVTALVGALAGVLDSFFWLVSKMLNKKGTVTLVHVVFDNSSNKRLWISFLNLPFWPYARFYHYISNVISQEPRRRRKKVVALTYFNIMFLLTDGRYSGIQMLFVMNRNNFHFGLCNYQFVSLHIVGKMSCIVCY